MVHAEVTVAAVVRRASQYLVVEEMAGGRAVLNQPAGHVERGETPIEAVVRETREESGWRFHPTGFVGVYYWPHADGRITLRIALCGDVDDHAPDQPLDAGILRTHWLSSDALAARSNLRSALVLQSIRDYERFAPMSLERVRHIEATT